VTRARLLLALGALLVLGTVNYSIVAKENIKAKGEVIYLDLAPIDPRSLVQGDYMALRFRLAQEIEQSFAHGTKPLEGEERLAPIKLDERRVASLAATGAAAPLRVRYRMRRDAVWLGTNAFFFEEGSAARYANARYGEFRLDAASGEALLVGLRDAKLAPL